MRPLILALLMLWPVSAHTTAGFAERHSELLYSSQASILWIHPGDGCDCGKFCFQVVRRGSRVAGFRGLQRSLAKINAPAQPGSALIFAQTCGEEHWIVYDLAAEEYLADTPSYDEALSVWKSTGHREPRFADASHGAKGLRQSWSSFAEDTVWTGVLFLPLIVMAAFPLGIIACFVLLARYRRTRRGRDLALAILVLVPTLPGWWFVWVVFVGTAWHRGG